MPDYLFTSQFESLFFLQIKGHILHENIPADVTRKPTNTHIYAQTPQQLHPLGTRRE